MHARIRKAMEKDEGFTLIELLVVMIIIGILAAIAIPAFLAQRDKGYQTAIKSDLKNMSITEESYATDNDGAYKAGSVFGPGVTGTSDPALVANGAKLSDGVTVVAVASTSTVNAVQQPCYYLNGSSSKTGAKWHLSSLDNKVATGTTATC